jgi:hypothetical protein
MSGGPARPENAMGDQFKSMKKQNGADQTCAIPFAGNQVGKGFFYSVNEQCLHGHWGPDNN